MRVLGWLGDYTACGHYRLYFPFERNGWRVTDRAIMDADLIVAQRPLSTAAAKHFQLVCADPSKTAVLELDDDLLHVDQSNPAYEFFNDPKQQRRLIDLLGAAHLVTVSTQPLADLYREYTDKIVVLPNYIPRLLLNVEPSMNEKVVIGWAGGSSHNRDFGELAKPLKRVLQRYGDRVEFHSVGANHTARVASIRGRTRHTRWAEDVWTYYDHLDFDIGLAPLHPSRFNEGKSDLRLLELAALGIPTIASPVGPYATAIQDGCPAIPAETHKDWERALVDLIEDSEERRRLGAQGREWASQRTIEDHAHLWREAYDRTRQEVSA